MTAQQMWDEYCEKTGHSGPYEAWAFGCAPDELAQLTFDGIKQGTSSALACYVFEGEQIPQAGDYSVILDSREEAVCIIRNVEVKQLSYREVGEREANLEGEGDRTLAYWRSVHEPFFRSELEAVGDVFSEDMTVVFEQFVKVYP